MAVERDRIDMRNTLVWGGVSVLVIFLTIILVEGFYFDYKRDQDERLFDRKNVELLDEEARQKEVLATTRWVDRDEKRVQVPIEAAMKMTVEQENRKKDK